MKTPFKKWPGTLLAVIACIAFCLPAQADTITINPSGPVFDIGLALCNAGAAPGFPPGNLTWGGTGPCSVNNIYVFTPLSNTITSCLYLYDLNGTTTQAVVLLTSVSADPNEVIGANGFKLKSNNFQAVGASIATIPSTTASATAITQNGSWFAPGIGLGTVAVASFSTVGVNRAAINLSGGANLARFARLVLVQTVGTQCGANPWNPAPSGVYGGSSGASPSDPMGLDVNFYCPFTAFANNPAVGTTQLVSGFSGSKIRVCSIVWSQTPASTFKLIQGTTANCAAGTTDVTGTLPTTATGLTYVGGNTAPYVLVATNSLCAVLGTASATGTIEVHYGYF